MTCNIIQTQRPTLCFRSSLASELSLLLLAALAGCSGASEPSSPANDPALVQSQAGSEPSKPSAPTELTAAPTREPSAPGATAPELRSEVTGGAPGEASLPEAPSAPEGASPSVPLAGVNSGAAPDPSTPGALAPSDPNAPYKFTPDVIGLQRVLAVGCRFADTASPDLLDFANSGIQTILDHTHDYFDIVSNHRVDFEGEFVGWRDLSRSSGDYDGVPDDATKDCQDAARSVLAERGESALAYRAVVLLFNRDIGMSNQTGSYNDHVGTYVRLRYSGGTGGGWTSEALWAHELGHAFGLVHSTFPTREAGNQYNDFQDAMSGFAHSAQERWNFPVGGVCNGIIAHPECIYSGQADELPVHYSAFQKQRLGWLSSDQMVTHTGGTSDYQLAAPSSAPNDDSPLQRLKLIHVRVPDSAAYYAIEYRRGNNHGAESDDAAVRRGWDAVYEKGIRSDRVTVYFIDPANDSKPDDLGDANLAAVLEPGAVFDAPADQPALHVSFGNIVDAGNAYMRALVTITAP